jgi:hypothetical protein
MASKTKKVAKAVPFNPADVANVTKATPYIQRLIQDEELRDNVRTAFESSKSAYARLSNGKAPARSLFENKKLQNDLRTAYEALRDAGEALSEGPKRRARKGFSFGRKVLLAAVAGGAALAGSEKLRSKLLDTLFGAEEEFQYSPPGPPTSAQPSAPVSAA